MNVLKNANSSYVQNMMEYMILMSYSDMSQLVTNHEYIASIRMMSPEKLEQQISHHFFARQNVLPHDTKLLSRKLCYTMTITRMDATIHTFLVSLILKNCNMLHHCLLLFARYITKHLFHPPVTRDAIQKFVNNRHVIFTVKI